MTELAKGAGDPGAVRGDARAARREGRREGAMKRAIGIVRVSAARDRGDSFQSPEEQREAIERECRRHEFELVDVLSELDVSGRRPLVRRPGLRAGIERVEAG